MQVISSKDNEFVKHVKKLKEKKYRDINQEFIIEGIKLVKEAIEEKANIKNIIICDNCEDSGIIPKNLMYEIAKYNCIYVTENILKTMSDVNAPQGILAIISMNNKNNEIDYSQDIIVALDDIQDPGNLGTILRTVDSVGLNQILVSKGTADCYNPKVVRSTMGAIFRIKIIECENLEQTLKETQKNNFKILPKHPLSLTEYQLYNYEEGFRLIDWDTMTKVGAVDEDAKHIKMAECLSDKVLPVESFACLYVATDDVKEYVKELLRKNGIQFPPPYVNVMSQWF